MRSSSRATSARARMAAGTRGARRRWNRGGTWRAARPHIGSGRRPASAIDVGPGAAAAARCVGLSRLPSAVSHKRVSAPCAGGGRPRELPGAVEPGQQPRRNPDDGNPRRWRGESAASFEVKPGGQPPFMTRVGAVHQVRHELARAVDAVAAGVIERGTTGRGTSTAAARTRPASIVHAGIGAGGAHRRSAGARRGRPTTSRPGAHRGMLYRRPLRRSRRNRGRPATLHAACPELCSAQSRRYIVITQAPPRPRLCCSATFAPSTWRLSAWPRSCQTSSVHCARPVAPSGWPFESRPPDGFVTNLPP